MVKTLLLVIAALLCATAAHAGEKMPSNTWGQWCLLEGDKHDGYYKKAINYCREDRPIAFDIFEFGFYVKLRGVKIRVMCVPTEVEGREAGGIRFFNVTAACGADDNSVPVVSNEFQFIANANEARANKIKTLTIRKH